MSDGPHLLLYDGLCGLCNRLNRFVLKRDTRDRFRFASLQGEVGRAWVARMGGDPDDLTTFRVVADFEGPNPRMLSRGRAGLFVLDRLGGPWKASNVLRLLPGRVLDWGYDVIARRRYRWFGRLDACPIPSPEVRRKFIGGE